jgi:hypothetical protein
VYPPDDNGHLDSLHHVGVLYRACGLTGALRPEPDGSTDRCDWFTRKDAELLPLTSLARFALDVA